jgi:hypothetical protein
MVELLVCGILVLFFLFYFNRLFAALVSYGIRAYTWHKFRVYIDVQALQISLLGGRIFFKGLRYHGHNETILVQHGYLTWQYWILSVKQVDLIRFEKPEPTILDLHDSGVKEKEASSSEDVPEPETAGIREGRNLPCRISISISGLEWFVYNRSPAYDAIVGQDGQLNVDRQKGKGDNPSFASGTDLDQSSKDGKSRATRLHSPKDEALPSQNDMKEYTSLSHEASQEATKKDIDPEHESMISRSTEASHLAPLPTEASLPLLLRILPVWVECHKGAIILGNETTRAILTTTFDDARGHIDASSSGPRDQFRQIFDFQFDHPVVQMRPNPDFSQLQKNAAEKVLFEPEPPAPKGKRWSVNWQLKRRQRHAWHNLRNLVPYFRRSVESFHASSSEGSTDARDAKEPAYETREGPWLGLGRYLADDEHDNHAGWTNVEYAKFSTVLDSPSVHLNFYWDTPGQVTLETSHAREAPHNEDINGCEPPAYGLDLTIGGGTINYGPWTDRLRAELQSAFFPNPFQNVNPAQKLEPGSLRQSTVMKINITIEEEVNLRVPTRESSKDWQWKGRADALRGMKGSKKQREKKHFRLKKAETSGLGPDIRPFGWLAFHVDADSTATYEMDMVPGSSGYRNRLEVDLKGTRASSSVNHAFLWKCGPQQLSCDLSNPLGWNDLHTWVFSIHSQSMELFLLRDHMFLLTDLIGDFTSGPDADYMTFVPFQYNIKLFFKDAKMYLNANDANIIDSPCNLEENSFLILGFEKLDGSVDIPMRKFSPVQNSVLFKADGHNVRMELSTPLWNTLHTFVSDDPIAVLKDLALDGSYNYKLSTSSQLTDTLFLNISGMSLRVYLHGFLIKYFMKMKDNYFGEFMHFKTLEEHQEISSTGQALGPEHLQSYAKKDDELDVILNVRADKSCALLPANLYSRKDNVRFDVLLAEADMRFTSYYMDLSVKSSPIEGSLESLTPDEVGASSTVSNTQLFVDGVSVYGHRLFGLPPSEPTYVCNWDFDVGKIVGECSSVFIRTLAFAGTSFAFTLDDDENTISIANTTTLHDITFLRARVESIGLWFLIDDAALTLQTGHIDVSFNDWAGAYFSDRVHANIPNITVAAIDQRDAVRHRGDIDEPVKPFACFETSVNLKLVERKADFAKGRARQQYHVRFHDQRTHRADWLLHSSDGVGFLRERDRYKGGPPSMPIPHMPQPATELAYGNGKIFAGPVHDKQQFLPGHTSSFLSLPLSQKSRGHGFGSRRSSIHVSKSSGPTRSNEVQSRVSRQGSPGLVPKSNASNMGSGKRPSTSAATITFSSPWSPPYFPLQKIKLDRTHLPQITSDMEPAFYSNPKRVDQDTFEAPDEGPRTTHASFLIDARPGLTGFCTPQLFGVISAFLKQFQPEHPVDILDQVQIDTMSRILKLRKLRSKARLISDFRIHLPFLHLRLINVDDSGRNSLRTEQHDQYDLILAQLGLTFRLFDHAKNEDEERRTERGVIIFTRANEIYAAVTGKSAEASSEMASAQISFEDVEFWLSSRPQIDAKLQLHSVEAFTRSRQIGYLSSLIHRTGVVAEQIGNDFNIPDQNHNLRHLVYHLTVEGAHFADPAFLTKPSYVLRSAGDHLRTNDSWKIMSRLRSIYESLPGQRREQVVAESSDQYLECPRDAEKHVLASFDQWRNWDHGNVQESFLMERIWGKAIALPNHLASQHIRGDLFVGSIRLLLDPGPKQNECAVKDLGIIAAFFRTSETIVKAGYKESQLSQKLTIQGYCSRIALQLNWVLVDLIGDTLVQFEAAATEMDKSTPSPKPQAPEDVSPNTEVQLVFGTDLVSAMFDSANLTLTFAAEKLRASAIQNAKPRQHKALNLVLSSNSALMKLLSNESQILGWKLSLPVMHASQSSKPGAPEKPSDVRLAGICHKLRFDLKEDILRVLSITQRVIDDEVSLVSKLISKLKVGERPPNRAAVRTGSLPLNVRVALFLDDYRLNFRLLPSLAYTISGKVARTSLRPGRNSAIQVDLDLGGHTHSFQSENGQGRATVATLGFPPINGRVLIKRNDSVLSIDADTTLEEIRLEAANLRSCFDAVTKPETAQAVKDTQRSIKETFARLETMFASPSSRSTEDRKPLQVLQYGGRVTLHGLVVHCSAPGLKGGDYHADLEFHLGLVTAHVHNRTSQVDVIHDRPQFDVQVRRIGLALGRRGRSGLTNVGELIFNARATGATEPDKEGNRIQVYRASSDGFSVDLFEETASLIVDVVAFLQERIKSLVIPNEVKQIRPLRRMTLAGLSEKPVIESSGDKTDITSEDTASSTLLGSTCDIELGTIQIRWIVLSTGSASTSREQEDLVFSIKKIDLSTKREGSARLAITDLQLQMVPKSLNAKERSANSALLPEVVFSVAHMATKHDRRFAFQAAGKALDLRLASDFIVPASLLQSSLGLASEELRKAKTLLATTPTLSNKEATNILGSKRLASLLVDADFAGAVVNIQARRVEDPQRSVFGILKGEKRSRAGRYGQVVHGEAATEAILRAPGVAFKVEYRDTGSEDPSLSAEIKVAASSNVLYPSVVPLIIEISSSIKEIVRDSDATQATATATEQTQTQKYLSDATISNGDPATILGRCKLNIGLWISKQEFSLSCQPIARVAATARFNSIFMTLNTVQSSSQQRFFALLINFNQLQASVQHVYSRESTASFDVDSIVISLMNSKHVTLNAGISAILNISPMSIAVNAKQLQDFLLFREIWYPAELRQTSTPPTSSSKGKKTEDTHAYIVQRYQQVAAASAFQWNAVASIQELKVQLDLGQGLGKSLFTISKLWASAKKDSDWEQNLCIGFDKVAVESTGRMSGFIELQNFRVRTSIRWPLVERAFEQTPLVQASLGFDELRVKAAFDYQPFGVADISTLEFLMYNVRPTQKGDKDRLVGILDGDKVQVFCTTSTAAQSLALYQAVVRLIEEKETDYEASLKELDRYLRRKSVFPASIWTEESANDPEDAELGQENPIYLHTDVVVTLRAINAGVFPSTFFDNQIFKVEATDAQARFAVSAREDKTRSELDLTLGQLRVALSNVNRSHTQALGEVSVDDIVSRATSSRGGTILKVPKVVVAMRTWQRALSNNIDYTFKSTFEGKIDVGWNYSRVSFIRGMWSAHARALAHRLGKPLPQSAVQIKGGPQPDDPTGSDRGQEKITAVVNVPQSRFEYTALKPPIIDTPQLRDMGEATPPLEWIGLHRDRLPNLTHQIIIVTLLEVAKEVEKAYALTLGYSPA